MSGNERTKNNAIDAKQGIFLNMRKMSWKRKMLFCLSLNITFQINYTL